MHLRLSAVSLLALVTLAACKSGGIPEEPATRPDQGGNGGTSSSAGAGGSGDAGTTGTAGTAGVGIGGSAGAGVDVSCGYPDCDGDGYATPEDCNDTDAAINPDAYDFLDDKIDNDCSGQVDNPVESCEPSPSAENPTGTALEFARAMDICPQKSKNKAGAVVDPLLKFDWGKVSGPGLGQQNWTSQTKPALQTNIVSSFGQNQPRRGLNMAGLSTGRWGSKNPYAEDALDPAQYGLNDACAAIPLAPDDCKILSNGSPKGGVSVQDFAELDLWLQVPSNVKGVSFDFAFFTSEFTQFWNAATNDAFFVLASTSTMQGVNVAKQANGTGISVNSGFFQLCPKVAPPNLTPDKLPAVANCVGNDGDAMAGILGSITGTYYDGSGQMPPSQTVASVDGKKVYLYGGGTGWLSTALPVTPGEQIMLRFMIMDTFDGLKDSSVLLDNWKWIPVPVTEPGVIRPPK